MKRLIYNNITSLKRDYLNIFQDRIPKIQQHWDNIWERIPQLQVFPRYISDILIMDFDDLANLYEGYQLLSIEDEDKSELNRIFPYKGINESIVTKFFRTHSQEMGISTCCYCDLAYINAYSVKSNRYSHFDIDHFFPKSKCPIIGLSLFNLVPSCPICNERLKRNNVVGNNTNEWKLLCPTSKDYFFDENVTIRILPKETFKYLRFQEESNSYYIYFDTNSSIYSKEVEQFHLNERYEFHKCEALHLLDLKRDYPDSCLKMIGKILKRSDSLIKEDIFHSHFVLNMHRVFGKLSKDILGINSNSVK